VLDASAVLALMQGEPGSEKLRKLLPEALVSAVNQAEIIAKLVNHGMPAPEAQSAFDALHLEVTAFDADLAALSAQYVRKGISLGDRCFLASAFRYGRGYTSDRDLWKLLGKIAPDLEFFR
jgi:PIN domain nuclease of toxin-antitoxin system